MLKLMDSLLNCCSIMYYYVFFYSRTFESRGRIEIAQTISTTTTKTLLCSCFPQVACMMAYVLFMLLCLHFERRETYCFSLIFFCFFSAKLVRTITFLSFQIGQLYLVCGCMTIRWCVAYRIDL